MLNFSNSYYSKIFILAYVSTPTLAPHGNQMRVDWQSQGRGAGVVYGYLIEFRTNQDPRWQRAGYGFWKVSKIKFKVFFCFRSITPYQGDNMPYSGQIHGLPRTGTTFVHILVLDRNQQVIYTSGEARHELRCNGMYDLCFSFVACIY